MAYGVNDKSPLNFVLLSKLVGQLNRLFSCVFFLVFSASGEFLDATTEVIFFFGSICEEMAAVSFLIFFLCFLFVVVIFVVGETFNEHCSWVQKQNSEQIKCVNQMIWITRAKRIKG